MRFLHVFDLEQKLALKRGELLPPARVAAKEAQSAIFGAFGYCFYGVLVCF